MLSYYFEYYVFIIFTQLVKQAVDYVDEGNQNMVSAIEYAKQVRKQQLICVIIILVVVGVILAVMAMQGMIQLVAILEMITWLCKYKGELSIVVVGVREFEIFFRI